MNKGYTHVYYGTGKGKTSAALGLAIRSAGAGLRVYVARFLKDANSSELNILRNINNISLADTPTVLPFYFNMTQKEKEKYKVYAHQLLKTLMCKISDFDVVILDEYLDAVNLEIFSIEDVKIFLDNKPNHVELVLTGHELITYIKDRADYVSFIQEEKHPFNEGIVARKGIEF